jgi:hypothetical protein
MSDPKWATDIANKKPLLSYDVMAGTDSFSDTGSSTNSTSTVGAKRDTIFGHTNRIHIWTPGTFTGAISFVKNALSSAMGDILGIFVGGKSETIHNCDSRKIFGSKKRIRLGYRLQDLPFGKNMALMPGLGGLLNWIGEMTWKEESFSRGDRSDTVHGNIDMLVVNGGEKKMFSNNEGGWKNKTIIAGKISGLPLDKVPALAKPSVKWEGLTYSTTNAATGYSFATDKSYIVSATQNESGDPNIISFSATDQTTLKLESSEARGSAYIMTDDFSTLSKNSSEIVSETKTIKSNVVNVACKESLNLGVSRSTIRIVKGKVTVAGSTDLGGPDTGIEVDDEERLAREEQERIAQEEQERIEALRRQMQEIENQLLLDAGDADAIMRG